MNPADLLDLAIGAESFRVCPFLANAIAVAAAILSMAVAVLIWRLRVRTQ